MDNNQKNQQRGPQNDDMNKKDKMPGGQGQGGQNKMPGGQGGSQGGHNQK